MKNIQPQRWFTRKFNHIHEPGIFPCIVERLRGTPIRLENYLQSIPSVMLIRKPNDVWSAKEHLGHLLDLEPLWYGRVGDIKDGKKMLREADLENTKTHKANHNARNLETLLNDFRKERQKLIALLDTVPEKDFEKSALHPRLLTPMKMIDLAYFVAEHDDHHLAMIRWILGE